MRIAKRSKEVVNFLKKNLTGGKALVIMHDNPDPDCLSAAMCLRKIFEKAYNVPTTIAYGGVIGRAENRKLVSECNIPIERIGKLKAEDYSFIATVDGQPHAGNVSVKQGMKIDLVMDHHPRNAKTRNIPWVDIRTRYGASATIAYEYCLAHKLEIDRVEATALMYALKTETRDLGMESGPADRRAYMNLVAKADFDLLFNIVHAKVSREYFQVLSRALEQAKVHNDVMITALHEIGTPEYVAEVADMLLRLKGVTWTMVTGMYQGAIYLSIRTNDRKANSGDVMTQVVDGLGSGGGHDMMAGGRIPLEGDNADADKLKDDLSQRLLRALKKRSAGSDLLKDD